MRTVHCFRVGIIAVCPLSLIVDQSDYLYWKNDRQLDKTYPEENRKKNF